MPHLYPDIFSMPDDLTNRNTSIQQCPFKVGDIITGLGIGEWDNPDETSWFPYNETINGTIMSVTKIVDQTSIHVKIIEHINKECIGNLWRVNSKYFKLVKPAGLPTKGLAYQVYLQERLSHV